MLRNQRKKLHYPYLLCREEPTDLYILQVRNFEKIISGLRNKQRKEKRTKKKEVEKAEATNIFDRFKSGNKLSTEDLLVLQKGGYL